MKATISAHPLIAVLAAFLAGVLVIGGVWAAVSNGSADPDAAPVDQVGPAPAPSTTAPTEAPVAQPSGNEGCDAGTVEVASAADLQSALDAAAPGDVIALAPGTYLGNFIASTSGTKELPIELCGSADSILDGGDTGKGYVLHLDGAQFWHLKGFSVTNGQKGVMADTTVGSVIEGLTVSHIGHEAIHLRKFSTDNSVIDNRISDTGLDRDKFGEGVYIGTAESNLCDITDCELDASDRNLVEGNDISATTAESIDIKEGTTGGVIRNNTFDGSQMTEDGDSWVDIKGNGYLIEGNVGTNSIMDGFQTHEILDGWGTDNTFRNNTAEVNGPGFGYSLTPENDNVVECNNTASGAEEGVTNVTCSP